MEEVIYLIECLGLPGYPQFSMQAYHFTIIRLFDNHLNATGNCRIKIPLTALNIEQEIATHKEQEDFLYNMPIHHLNIWNGVVEITESQVEEFLNLIRPNIVRI